MQRFKDKLKEIEKQEEIIQRKKVMLDQKHLGQKLLEQQKAMTSSSLPTSETQSSSSKKNNKGTFEPAKDRPMSGLPKCQNQNAYSNDGSFLKAFQLLQQKQQDVHKQKSESSAENKSEDGLLSFSPPAPPPPPPPPPQPNESCSFQHSAPMNQQLPLQAPPQRFVRPPGGRPGQPLGHYPSGPPPLPHHMPRMPPAASGNWTGHSPNPPQMNFSNHVQPPMPIHPYPSAFGPHQYRNPAHHPMTSVPNLPIPPPPPPPPQHGFDVGRNDDAYDPLQPTEDSDSEDPLSFKCQDSREQARKTRKSRWSERGEDLSVSDGDSPPAKLSPQEIAQLIAKNLSEQIPPQSEIDVTKQTQEQLQLKAMEEYIRARQNAQRAAIAIETGLLSAPKANVNKARQHAYDSDEEIDDDGTWEHKARKTEMEATREWAFSLNEMSHGKHHIGDFLPPEELTKFMTVFQVLKNGQIPQTSDYEEFKLTCENVGFQMLEKLGWKEGEGIGKSSQGILDPVGRGPMVLGDGSMGLAPSLDVNRPNLTSQPGETGASLQLPSNYDLSSEDTDFDAYRKRMMLAYRFRPNPLNNPRRPYY